MTSLPSVGKSVREAAAVADAVAGPVAEEARARAFAAYGHPPSARFREALARQVGVALRRGLPAWAIVAAAGELARQREREEGRDGFPGFLVREAEAIVAAGGWCPHRGMRRDLLMARELRECTLPGCACREAADLLERDRGF